MVKVCEGCGTEFHVQPSEAHFRFCSNACRKLLRIKKECSICGSTFEVVPSHAHYIYCSAECRYKAFELTRIKKQCVICHRDFTVPPNLAAFDACSPPCRVEKAKRDRKAQFVARFWSKVNKTDTCWEWTGVVGVNGYARVVIDKRAVTAHRLVYEWTYGPIPEGLFACHTCDNRRCVRPDHIFLGTNDDNMADMVAKDRQVKGERNYQAKLTEAAVRSIRRRYALGDVLLSDLAREYGVRRETISNVVYRKTWRHVKDAA